MKIKCLLKYFIVISFAIVLIEICLRIIGFLYIYYKFDRRQDYAPKGENVVRIMFIGDSWTEGADAERGKGYPDQLIELIRRHYPNSKIEGCNYGRGCFNSSEASFMFLKHYKKVKPSLLIILFGINNQWNSQDIALCNKYFEKELNFNLALDKISVWDKIFVKVNRLKLVKLFRIIHFNFFLNKKDLFGPLPINSYTGRYFDIHGTGEIEKARDYLIDNLESASSYDDFYRVMLFSFNHNDKDVEEYLKKRGAWRPHLLKHRLNQKEHNYLTDARYKILEGHIFYLKQICDLHSIKIILQSYPYYGNERVDELHERLREIADKFKIPFVDHYFLFRNALGIENWKRVMTYSHVNTKGYALMAENLYNFLESNRLLSLD